MNVMNNSTSHMALAERLKTEPVTYARTVRPDMVFTATSGKAGKSIPLAFIPLAREDAVETSRFQVRAYMDETAELLLNPVYCTFYAYCVPKLAFDRYEGDFMALTRSYMGEPERDDTVIPWIEGDAYGTAGTPKELYKAAGLHAGSDTATVNSDYIEAYEKVFEFRCRQRSEALWAAVEADVDGSGDLLPAFFDNPQMAMIKPSFDSQMLDGEVPITLTDTKVALQNVYTRTAAAVSSASPVDGTDVGAGVGSSNYSEVFLRRVSSAASSDVMEELYGELAEQGLSMTVANIDLARETAAWAKVRSQYSGIDDDSLIDLLMSGIRVPEQYLTKPMLLARQRVPFGMTQRYSTDADALEVSATKGVAGTNLTVRCPQIGPGGVIVIMAEVVPGQFWERSKDYFFLSDNDTRRPDRLLDQLDPQAVEVVENEHFDVRHSDPNGIGGYGPLNHMWVRRRYNLGGKFHKTDPSAPWNENRNRVWASEPVDPTLSKEFWLATDLPDEIFISNSAEDNFEFSLAGQAQISGLTYLAPALREQGQDYEAIMARVDKTFIQQEAAETEEALVVANDDDEPAAANRRSEPSSGDAAETEDEE